MGYCAIPHAKACGDGQTRLAGSIYTARYRWFLHSGDFAINKSCGCPQPTERTADPSVIATLFSLILSTRTKLFALGVVCHS